MSETQSISLPATVAPDVVIPDYLQTLLDEIAGREGFTVYTIATQPGSNIGDGFQGIMLSVVIAGERNGKVDDKLVLICKIPPLSELRREFSAVPFKNEIQLYKDVLPAMVQFQRDSGVSAAEGFFAFPKCYGTYANADKFEFAIVLEDLRVTGYRMWDKFKPIDYTHVQMAVAELGRLHAISFAMRSQQPHIFEQLSKVESTIFKSLKDFPPAIGFFNKALDRAMESLRPEDVVEHKAVSDLKENLLSAMDKSASGSDAEPYTVLCHGDFWNNNMMFEYASADSLVPLRVCIIDWQLSQYCSPATDVMYYLYTSTEKTLRDKHFDEMLQTYHRHLAKLLERLGGDAANQFPFEEFQKQLSKFGVYAMIMAPIVLQAVTVKADEVPDLDALTLENSAEFEFMQNSCPDVYNARISDVIRHAVGRGYMGDLGKGDE